MLCDFVNISYGSKMLPNISVVFFRQTNKEWEKEEKPKIISKLTGIDICQKSHILHWHKISIYRTIFIVLEPSNLSTALDCLCKHFDVVVMAEGTFIIQVIVNKTEGLRCSWMEHLRAFITAWLSICLVMLKCVWRCVSFNHTACFCVKCAVTVADLTALHHSHCSLMDSLPSCSPSVAWDHTGRSSSPPPPPSSLLSSPISPVVLLLLFYLPFPSTLYFYPHPPLPSSPSSSLNVN